MSDILIAIWRSGVTYRFLKANPDGAVKVIAPVNVENMPRLKPFARIGVGKTSATQMKAGASKHCKGTLVRMDTHDRQTTYLEKDNVEEHEKNASGIPSLIIRAKILHGEKSFSK